MEYSIHDLLSEIKDKIENTLAEEKYLVSKGNYNGFEVLFNDVIKEMDIDGVEFRENYGHHFPDIDIVINDIKYGLELKSRTDGSWINNGGSVFESISSQDYQDIYLLFGTINKKKNEPYYKVKYAPYWTVTEDIKVTHKPRYFINMDTQNSIFNSKSEYDIIREMSELEKNSYVQKILRENANKAQWYISESENVLPTLIKDLDKGKKDELISELLILYPQDILRFKSDYKRVTEYLISTYFYYSPSIRDLFSAGGKYVHNNVSFPKVIEQFRYHNNMILKILEEQSPDFKALAYNSWKEIEAPTIKQDIVEDYKIILNTLGNEYLSEELADADVEQLTNLIFDSTQGNIST